MFGIRGGVRKKGRERRKKERGGRGERRGEREKRNRWCSQTILHRVLTVGKSIRDSRFDLYDQIPVGATTEQDRAAEME